MIYRWKAKLKTIVRVTLSIIRTKGKIIILIIPAMFIITWFIAAFKVSKEVDSISYVDNLEQVILDNKDLQSDLGPADWTDDWYCNATCPSGRPCQYRDEVDFRIIVITYRRRNSLRKCLNSILNLDTLQNRVSVEIWIDRSDDDVIDHETVLVGQSFKTEWQHRLAKGRACVHLQNQNAFINGQWINTWRPRKNTGELALILEDDLSISRYAYKWLKATHSYFRSEGNIAGYTLQMEGVNFFAPIAKTLRPMDADPSHTIFLYPVIGTWGYAPHPESWRHFQDWYHTVRPEQNIRSDYIKPNVVGILPNGWYESFKQRGTQESMWEMWHIKFTHDKRLFTVYSNIKQYSGNNNVLLSTNRKEKGLHFEGNDDTANNTEKLMTKWDDNFVKFPEKSNLIKYNYDGSNCSDTCCFSTTCGNFIKTIWTKSWKLTLKWIIP